MPTRGGIGGALHERIQALDGLRALAVAAVVVYHLDISWGGRRVLSGGFLGVDLFFVLSGYLIASLVTTEIARSSTVGLWSFWARRFRRLMPAALLLISSVTLWGVLVGWGRDIDSDVLASIFWVQNWHLIVSQEPYIASLSDPSPLTHFWSLSIEEQWYLAFPVLALWARKVIHRRPSAAAVVAIVAAGVSALVMALVFEEGSWRAYFGTDSRIFALLIGCAFAFLPATGFRSRLKHFVAVTLLLIGVATWFLMVVVAEDTDAWMYPWGFLLVAFASASAVIGAARSNVGWFDSGFIQWLGLRSYSIYLWHWPVFVALSAERTGLDGVGLVVLRLAVAAVLVEVSFRLVERPFRTGRFQRAPAKKVVSVGLLASAVVALVAVLAPIDAPKGGSAEVLAEATAAAEQTDEPAPASGDDGMELLVVGDSVAFGLGFGTDASDAAGSPVQLLNNALPGCGLTRLARPDSTYLVGDVLARCLQLGDEWAEALDTRDPEAVVYVVGPYDNLYVLEGDERLEAGTPEWSEAISRRLDESFDILTSTGRPVIAVVPACRFADPAVPDMPELTAELVAQLASIVERVASERPDDVSVRDASSWQCDGQGQPVSLADGAPIRDDGVHYTEPGKRAFWEWMVPEVRDVIDAHNDSAAAPFTTDASTAPSTTDTGFPSTTDAGPALSRTVLVIGDGVGGSLARGAREAAGADGLDLQGYYFPGCTLVGGDVIRPDGQVLQPATQCEPIRDGLAEAVESVEPGLVVLLLGNYEVYDRVVDGRTLQVGTAEYEAFLRDELSRVLDDARREGAPLVVLTPPCLSPTISGSPVDNAGGVYDPQRLTWLADVFSGFAESRPFEAVGLDLQALVCPDGVYRQEVDGVNLYENGARFTGEGAEFVWNWLLPQVEEFVLP